MEAYKGRQSLLLLLSSPSARVNLAAPKNESSVKGEGEA